ncbi:MAG: phage portal protein, partial [Phycisphaerales bacterium]
MSVLSRLFRRGAATPAAAAPEKRQVAWLTAGSDLRAQLGLWQPDGAVSVTVETALGVPAIWAAVNFRSGTLAALPLHVYRRERDGTVTKTNSPLNRLLHDAPNEAMSAFDFFKFLFDQKFTEGRGIAFIERSPAGQVIALHPLELGSVTIRREAGRVSYELRENGRVRVYEAGEVLDLVLMRRPDGIGHRSPIYSNRDAIGHAIATTRYASKMFANGGVPPFAVTGNFASPGAMSRASEDISETIRDASKEARQALVLPAGLEIKQIGVDAEKMQLIEAQRFVVEQVARIWGIPPVFLQDLTHGTYTNTEQQ